MRAHHKLIQERVHDACRPGRKLRGPSSCPDCGALEYRYDKEDNLLRVHWSR